MARAWLNDHVWANPDLDLVSPDPGAVEVASLAAKFEEIARAEFERGATAQREADATFIEQDAGCDPDDSIASAARLLAAPPPEWTP